MRIRAVTRDKILWPDRQPARERNAHPSTRRDFSGLIQVGLQVPDAPKRFGRIGRPTCSRKRQHSYDAEGPTTHPLQGSEPKAISGMTKCLSMKSLVGLVLMLRVPRVSIAHRTYRVSRFVQRQGSDRLGQRQHR